MKRGRDVPWKDVDGEIIEIGDMVTIFSRGCGGGDHFTGEVVAISGRRCIKIMPHSYICDIGNLYVKKEEI